MEGSGCYGHNGADDAAADAALIARALPGTPVRVQWMREQEHAWEPYGPAMLEQGHAPRWMRIGSVVDWDYEVWSNTHSTRPGTAGSLLAGQQFGEAFPAARAEAHSRCPTAAATATRSRSTNSRTREWCIISFPRCRVRVSALRALGAYVNVFSIESFMDELAQAAGMDPVEFRLQHLEDRRARDVIASAAERFGWASFDRSRAAGAGAALPSRATRTYAAYCASPWKSRSRARPAARGPCRAVAAVDSGQVVNPDGLRNQIEGGIVQSMSWTLYERVTFDETRITSIDWSTYPILRFDAVPDSIDVHVIDRPGQPFLGTGEAARARQPPRSATRSPTQPASGCATCRSRANASGRRCRYSWPIASACRNEANASPVLSRFSSASPTAIRPTGISRWRSAFFGPARRARVGLHASTA